jgi:hypothetical protein
LAEQTGLTEVFDQLDDDEIVGPLLQSRDKRPGMRYRDYLGVRRSRDHEVGQRRQQVRMQAGLRLVEHQQRRRARGE